MGGRLLTYERGDRVWWWSEQSGWKNRSKAIYVEDDASFPKRDVILAIKIGRKKKGMVQMFRWPRKFTKPM